MRDGEDTEGTKLKDAEQEEMVVPGEVLMR